MQTMKLTWEQISVWCGAERLNGSKSKTSHLLRGFAISLKSF